MKHMKKLYFILFFSFSVLLYSQSLQEKYDKSYGIFEMIIEVDGNGHFTFQSLKQIQCENCSEKYIKKLNKEVIKSFHYNKEYYQEMDSNISNENRMNFSLPIVFKIKDFEKN